MNNKGFTMIELVCALAVIIVALILMGTIIANILRVNTSANAMTRSINSVNNQIDVGLGTAVELDSPINIVLNNVDGGTETYSIGSSSHRYREVVGVDGIVRSVVERK